MGNKKNKRRLDLKAKNLGLIQNFLDNRIFKFWINTEKSHKNVDKFNLKIKIMIKNNKILE